MKTIGASALFTLVTLIHTAFTYSSPVGFRVDLTHIDQGKGYSPAQLYTRAAQRSKIRAKRLSDSVKGPIHVSPSEGEYLLELAIGTPPLHFEGILDTGSDLIWTQCTTCMKCIPQPAPLFDPLHSKTFSLLPCTHKACIALASTGGGASCAPKSCMYHYSYGDGTSSIGYVGTETFTFGADKEVSVPKLGFGCGLYNEGDIQNSSGIVGFGRGPLSLVSQLGITTFSYCFTNTSSHDRSTLFFGSLAKLTGPNVRTVPLLPPKPGLSSVTFYYIGIKGISVGNTLLPVPPEAFQIQRDGSGGMIVDSGTGLLVLDKPIFNAFADAIKTQVRLVYTITNDGFCFSKKPAKVPKLVFHFGTTDWEIPEENLGSFNEENNFCLGVMDGAGLSILGNLQTQNVHVMYDLKNEQLSFVPKQCHQL